MSRDSQSLYKYKANELPYAPTDHSYYCEKHNCRVSPIEGHGRLEYGTWMDFKAEWLKPGIAYDDDYNHIFRFDFDKRCDPDTCEPIGGLELWLFISKQRNGDFLVVHIGSINECDMPEIDAFLLQRYQYLRGQWREYSDRYAINQELWKDAKFPIEYGKDYYAVAILPEAAQPGWDPCAVCLHNISCDECTENADELLPIDHFAVQTCRLDEIFVISGITCVRMMRQNGAFFEIHSDDFPTMEISADNFMLSREANAIPNIKYDPLYLYASLDEACNEADRLSSLLKNSSGRK